MVELVLTSTIVVGNAPAGYCPQPGRKLGPVTIIFEGTVSCHKHFLYHIIDVVSRNGITNTPKNNLKVSIIQVGESRLITLLGASNQGIILLCVGFQTVSLIH